jgi:prepilin-type N-terminal cleavage/methylation domain-containing protein
MNYRNVIPSYTMPFIRMTEMNSKTHSGFSLIELMVVIAVAAILAAVAVPAYQKYALKARLATLVPIMDSLVGQSIEYAYIHGSFPRPGDLGYEVGIPTSMANPTSLHPHLDAITMTGGACGRYGTVGMYTNFGSDNSAWFSNLTAAGFVDLFCYMYNYNGIQKKCFYTVGDGAHSVPGDFMTGFENHNSGDDYDYYLYYDLTDSPEWTGAQCL